MNFQSDIRDLLRAGLTPGDIRQRFADMADRERLNRTIAKARRDLGMTPRPKAASTAEPVRCYPQPRWTAEPRGRSPLPKTRVTVWDRSQPMPTFGDPAPDRNALAQGYRPGSGLVAERRA